ncbi:hypothetical protein B4Q04_09600 [Zobellia sp. OII3]|nr:hypothetical protein B4Q04_09600 [Zobellia sp. OII3]
MEQDDERQGCLTVPHFLGKRTDWVKKSLGGIDEALHRDLWMPGLGWALPSYLVRTISRPVPKQPDKSFRHEGKVRAGCTIPDEKY